MNLKHFLLVSLLLSSSTSCGQPQLLLEESSFLQRGISESTKMGDAPWIESLLRNDFTIPPFYDAAKYAYLLIIS